MWNLTLTTLVALPDTLSSICGSLALTTGVCQRRTRGKPDVYCKTCLTGLSTPPTDESTSSAANTARSRSATRTENPLITPVEIDGRNSRKASASGCLIQIEVSGRPLDRLLLGLLQRLLEPLRQRITTTFFVGH